MTSEDERRPLSRRPAALRNEPSLLGVPLRAVVAIFAAAALVGLVLAFALNRATSSDDSVGTGTSLPMTGLPVITERNLGTEVQRIVDTGTTEAVTVFDLDQCLQQQSVSARVLVMEQVQWGPKGSAAWVIVHGPTDRETLRENGGTVDVTVVTPDCGVGGPEAAAETLVWAGSTKLGTSP
ncbi:hypothetical protein JSY14_07415 [Brachybacterium sp. EF45031]|uniref:hypothetical protein n=1 Tax=Brachybacterium sillae TaxID=2810536 RepID=UPI00217DCD8B|nr:hypothetical protein [Brachybacterium sillae]MCS6711857.1 hypothetical protein [Brachybacterium sillae]